MKRIILMFLVVIGLTGCSLAKDMDNTPTKKVEAFLNKYQTLDDDVLYDLDTLVNKQSAFTDKQKKDYKDIIKSNYQKMTYVIKDEKVDGNEATVTTEIEVVDYTGIVSDSNGYLKNHPEEFLTDKKYDESLFSDYKISRLKEAKEKIKYTIDFTLTKADDEWMLDSITNEITDKINGSY